MTTKPYQRSIFIFRRDLRLEDNLGLINALTNSEEVIPIFIFTPTQIDKNPFKSDNAVQFMVESLLDLEQALSQKAKTNLNFYYGKPEEVLDAIIKADKEIDAVFINQDYSPYSKKRDDLLEQVCLNHGKILESHHDCLLLPVGTVKTDGGMAYQKFTPFHKSAQEFGVDKPLENQHQNYGKPKKSIKQSIPKSKLSSFYQKNPNLWRNGGRTKGLPILDPSNLKKHQNYNKDRNNLTKETTNLSAYLKFGCLSIRETYWAFKTNLKPNNDLLKQLYWREFYHNVIYFYPRVVGGALKEKYNELEWKNNKTHLRKWQEGMTGYPIIDAGMRSLNQTGYQHNRSRLITSNFLIKICLIDWRLGEKYFSNQLYDIDISNNNGNWQWGAGTGADSQPYFRIFNPWLQSKKFDPDATYIKRWIPELKDVPAKHLHQWDQYHSEYPDLDYPKPMIDYKSAKEEALKAYKKVA